jgi:hypothetical protein
LEGRQGIYHVWIRLNYKKLEVDNRRMKNNDRNLEKDKRTNIGFDQ